MSSLCAVVIGTAIVVGQAEDASAREHLKGLQWLIGRWACEGVLEEDVPGFGKEGDPFRASSSQRWILGGNAMQLDLKIEVNGKEVQAERALLAWDRTAKCIMEWAVLKDGHHSGPWKREGDVWACYLRGVNRRGEVESKIIFSDIGPKSFTLERKEKGQELEDSAKRVFKRVEAPGRPRRKKAESKK